MTFHSVSVDVGVGLGVYYISLVDAISIFYTANHILHCEPYSTPRTIFHTTF